MRKIKISQLARVPDPSNPIWNKLGEAANKLTSSVKSLKMNFLLLLQILKRPNQLYISRTQRFS